MKTKLFQEPGKSKSDLINCLEEVKRKYQSKIKDNNISIKRNGEIFNIYAEKKVFFKKYLINAKIFINDGSIAIDYETNVPERYESDFLKLVKKEIDSAFN